MKPHIVSAALGLLVGVIYALFNVRSPAPPVRARPRALVGERGARVGSDVVLERTRLRVLGGVMRSMASLVANRYGTMAGGRQVRGVAGPDDGPPRAGGDAIRSPDSSSVTTAPCRCR